MQDKVQILSMKDEEILFLSRKSPDVFGVLIERYQKAFLNKAKSLLGSLEEAEDLVQETFVKIYIHSDKFKVQPGASFKSWGYRILINNCYTYLKKRNRDRAMTADIEPEFYEAIPDTKSRDFEKMLLLDHAVSILSRLPNAAYSILEKYFIKGKSYEQIAEEEGSSVGAVRTRLHRAKKEFKKISLMLA